MADRAEIIVLHGDCRAILPTMPDGSVDCVVTSPPYFWLRDYGVVGQIGHEPDVASYVAVLASIFDEIRRILRDTGVVWLNLGDSYYSGNGQPTQSDPRSSSRNFSRVTRRPLDVAGWDVPKKSLLGIPWLVALELQRRGWTLRADVVWCRPTALQEASVTDRPHRQHEYVFLFSKSRRYNFDRLALPEQSVWNIAHERGRHGHSAAFPRELARRCILSGCPPLGMVLDPFAGSGTVGVVARELGRSATIVELSKDYADIAASRVNGATPDLFPVSTPV